MSDDVRSCFQLSFQDIQMLGSNESSLWSFCVLKVHQSLLSVADVFIAGFSFFFPPRGVRKTVSELAKFAFMKSEEQVAQHPVCKLAWHAQCFALFHVSWPLDILGAGPHLNGGKAIFWNGFDGWFSLMVHYPPGLISLPSVLNSWKMS